MVGKSLGPYKILEPLGAGGMGEVYLAEDTRLHRKVAVKVLPGELAGDPDRLARFEQEARAAAALNHPHIAAVHDVGVDDSIHYMVQEYLQGRTLREVVDDGALPLDEALALGTEIAEALGAAHRAGIVHRDLKPENIFLTEDGHAKVLDFGLAKLTEVSSGQPSGASMSPTVFGTQAGAIMGTAGYMAPEQVQGEPVDARTDLFAFGCVLYELVSGKRAFSGQSLVQTLNRIAHEEPPSLDTVDMSLPAELQRIVKKCLAKAPARRYQAAGDLTVDLRALSADLEAGRVVPAAREPGTVSRRTDWRSMALVGGVGAVVGAALVVLGARVLSRPLPSTPTRVAVTLTAPEYGVAGPPLVTISRDGRTVVYTGSDQLYRRDLEHLEVQPIAGTEGANSPFLSPDGRWVAFQGPGGLEKVSLSGGPASTLCETTVRGASWGVDDTILVGTLGGVLMRLSASGGDCAPLTTLAEGEVGHWRPDILPDGKSALFTVWTGSLETAQLAVVALETGERTMLGVNGTYPRYASTGHIVFARESSLWAVAFDVAALQVSGTPVPVVEQVRVEGTGAAQFALADDGSLLYVPGRTKTDEFRMVWVDRNGRSDMLPAPPRRYEDPTISPDGTRVAVTVDDHEQSEADVYIWDIARESLSRLTFDEAEDRVPLWTSDGIRVAFHSERDGGGVFMRAADGTGETEPVIRAANAIPWALTGDGQLLLSAISQAYVTVDGELGAEALLDPARRPALSADGRWLAYEANVTGQTEIYVRPFPEVNQGQWQVSADGGREPRWSPDGRELFFLSRQGEMVVARVETESTFAVSSRTPLFGLNAFFVQNTFPRRYDISPDGTRFLMLKPESARPGEGEAALPGMVLVLDWFDELQRLVPTTR